MQRRLTDVGSARRFFRDVFEHGAREHPPFIVARIRLVAAVLGLVLVAVGLILARPIVAFAGLGALVVAASYVLLVLLWPHVRPWWDLPMFHAWESEAERRAAGMPAIVPVWFSASRRPWVQVVNSRLRLSGITLRDDGDWLVAQKDGRDVARLTLLVADVPA